MKYNQAIAYAYIKGEKYNDYEFVYENKQTGMNIHKKFASKEMLFAYVIEFSNLNSRAVQFYY